MLLEYYVMLATFILILLYALLPSIYNPLTKTTASVEESSKMSHNE